VKVKVDIINNVGTLINTFTIERDVSEYIKTTREIFGEEWAEFLEQLQMEGLLN